MSMASVNKPRSKRRQESTGFVALLRGINVGGKHKLPMADLAAMFVEAGCTEVRTYIQSGNVAFVTPAAVAKRVAKQVSEKIVKRFGFEAPVVLRTADEMERVVRGNPFLKSGADPATLYVAFLADLPDARLVAGLDPKRSPGDSFEVRGREIYLHLPNGAARSMLTNAWFDSQLDTISTGRNWRTVHAMHELAQGNQRWPYRATTRRT